MGTSGVFPGSPVFAAGFAPDSHSRRATRFDRGLNKGIVLQRFIIEELQRYGSGQSEFDLPAVLPPLLRRSA